MEGINSRYGIVFKIYAAQGHSQFTAENNAVIGVTRVQLPQYFVLNKFIAKTSTLKTMPKKEFPLKSTRI